MARRDDTDADRPLGVVPVQQRSIRKRDAIYRSMLAEIASQGEHAARVDRVIEELGIGWGTFFDYFPRKADVLLYAAIEIQERMVATLRSTGPEMSAFERLTAGYHALVEPLHGNDVIAPVAREVLRSAPRFESIVRAERQCRDLDLLGPIYAAVLRDGQATGEVDPALDPADTAQLLHRAVLASLSRVGLAGAFGASHQMTAREVVDRSFAMLWNGPRAR